ncbi:hypothetical protein Cgig2_015015 [Carnegiea gigantea]|uniref:Uncharacterized protein n=1 Tax=Carnegiea gigantea TaxID=171969 RepID=A0A9Q1JK28_9CARY|nr:hypothetical protein Cgig2_015015 [Carnegiea gigantea]
MRGLPRCHALAVIAKANLWIYDYVHPIYKTTTQEVIYNQLVHPMEMHDMGIVDGKIGLVVVGKNWMRTTTGAHYPQQWSTPRLMSLQVAVECTEPARQTQSGYTYRLEKLHGSCNVEGKQGQAGEMGAVSNVMPASNTSHNRNYTVQAQAVRDIEL